MAWAFTHVVSSFCVLTSHCCCCNSMKFTCTGLGGVLWHPSSARPKRCCNSQCTKFYPSCECTVQTIVLYGQRTMSVLSSCTSCGDARPIHELYPSSSCSSSLPLSADHSAHLCLDGPQHLFCNRLFLCQDLNTKSGKPGQSLLIHPNLHTPAQLNHLLYALVKQSESSIAAL